MIFEGVPAGEEWRVAIRIMHEAGFHICMNHIHQQDLRRTLAAQKAAELKAQGRSHLTVLDGEKEAS